MGKLPGFIFYAGDWMKDPELRRCSKAAKGVWIDMLAMMFECGDRGVFSTGGGAWSDQEIAAAIGGDIAENLTCLEELLRKGVARRNSSGAIFSARMVRDHQTRIAERDKKRTQRFVPSNVPQLVPPSVPPLSVNANEDERKPEVVVVSEKSKFITAAFEINKFDEDFDGEHEFKRLCKVHPQPEDGIVVQRLWQQTIEREMKATGDGRRKVADRMHESAIIYRDCTRKVTYGLGNWMTKGIWKQGIGIWEGNNESADTAKARLRASLEKK